MCPMDKWYIWDLIRSLNMNRLVVHAFGGFHHCFETVGCACIVLPSSSAVVSSCIATQASAINSVACGPMMCTPRTSSYFFSADDLHEAFFFADDARFA